MRGHRVVCSSWLPFDIAVLAAAACHSVGPPGVVRDRFGYAEATSRSWKDQMLLSLVKLRYADAPVFLDRATSPRRFAGG
jgi:hypothetical protein